MNLLVSSFADVGNLEKERVVLKASADLELGSYAVFCSDLSSDGQATSGRQLAYWFPDGLIKADDLVVIYTKQGTISTKDLGDGKTVRFYYWGAKDSLWKPEFNNTAVILKVTEWTHKTPSKTSAKKV